MPFNIWDPAQSAQGADPMQVDLPPDEIIEEVPIDSSFIVENPNLDLESYTSGYTSYGRLQRLKFIAEHCPSLAIEAYNLCLNHLMETNDTQSYSEIHHLLIETARNQNNNDQEQNAEAEAQPPDAIAGLPGIGGGGGLDILGNQLLNVPALDTVWVNNTRKRANVVLEKLDTDLKNYKSNSIKESIRRGQDELGDHYLSQGDLGNAMKCYSRARDYCVNATQVVNMCLNVVKMGIYMKNWPHVLSYVQKAESTVSTIANDSISSSAKKSQQASNACLKACAGLAYLADRNYKQAAKKFLTVDFDYSNFNEIMTVNDIARYGTLCALASFDRDELKKFIITSAPFKQFLELEPPLREIIQKFYNSQYSLCLSTLEALRDQFLLDLYLSPHVKSLYILIRNRGLAQYFQPYMSADMRLMATAFNTGLPELEEEIVQLILRGDINARIDSHNKILFAKDVDERTNTYEKTIESGETFIRRTKLLLLRSVMIKNQIFIKGATSAPIQLDVSYKPSTFEKFLDFASPRKLGSPSSTSNM